MTFEERTETNNIVLLLSSDLTLSLSLSLPPPLHPPSQVANNPRAYKGVRDCFTRVLSEEGVGAFYRSLPPRLMSVVPMIAIQVTDKQGG